MPRSETTEQIKLFNWIREWEGLEPRLRLLFHVPNEGKRTNCTGSTLKAMGLRSGVSDIVGLVCGSGGEPGLLIEMKYGQGRTTKEQRDFMSQAAAEGYRAAVCYSADEARDIIREHLITDRGFTLGPCEDHVLPDLTCRGMGWERCRDCHIMRQGGR